MQSWGGVVVFAQIAQQICPGIIIQTFKLQSSALDIMITVPSILSYITREATLHSWLGVFLGAEHFSRVFTNNYIQTVKKKNCKHCGQWLSFISGEQTSYKTVVCNWSAAWLELNETWKPLLSVPKLGSMSESTVDSISAGCGAVWPGLGPSFVSTQLCGHTEDA